MASERTTPRYRGGYVLVGAGAVGALLFTGARALRRRPPAPGSRGMRFSPGYREVARLADGTRIRMRLVQPRDKGLLAEGLASLSAESGYLRFHAPKARFTEAELRYLTEVDGVNHLALGAETTTGVRRGLGVARFVRLPAEPTRADAAVAVRDDAQHKGLGRLLTRRLLAAARERGIRTLSFEVLSTNRAAIRMLQQLSPGATVRYGGTVRSIEVPTDAAG